MGIGRGIPQRDPLLDGPEPVKAATINCDRCGAGPFASKLALMGHQRSKACKEASK